MDIIKFVTIIAGKRNKTLVDDMALYWFLNEASGSRRNAVSQTNTLLDTGTAGTVNGHALFVLADSDYITIADNEDISLGTDSSFMWTINIKPAAVNVFQWIMGKSDGSNPGHDYVLYLTDDGKLNFRVGNSTTFQTVTTTGALVAGESHQVVFGHDAVNDLLSIKIDSGAIKTASWTGGTRNGTNNLSFGRHGAVNSNYYGGEIWNAGFWKNRFLTAAEQASIIGISYPFGVSNLNLPSALPNTVPNQHSWFDFSDLNYAFTDAAKTTKVASDADPIRAVSDKFAVSAGLLAASDAVRPLWKTNIQNSLACGLWNGTDSNMDETKWVAGDFTAFYVVKNLDVTYGSHVATPDNYLVITGTSYDADPRFVVHPVGGLDSAAVSLINGGEWNVLEIVRSGSSYQLFCNGIAGTLTTSTNEFLPDAVGEDNIAGTDWWAEMYLGERVRYSAALDARTRASIRYYLANKWAITPMYYQPYGLI